MKDKNLYKIFLHFIKISPNILAVFKITGLALNYFGIRSFVITCFGGTSVIFLVMLYLISYLFKFCGTHRLSIHYVTLVHVITMVDYYIGIPINVRAMFYLYALIALLFIITWIITWIKNKHNPIVNHIKVFCDRFADCSC